MDGSLRSAARFRLRAALAALALAATAVVGPVVLFDRAPDAFIVATAFAWPVLVAVLRRTGRLTCAALFGRPWRPGPPRVRGALVPRPYSPAQRRRPRT